MANLSIGYLEPDQVSFWDAFVDRSPEATFFHGAGWKQVIEDSFGHRCYFLCAWSGDQVRGVLPLVHVRSRIFGNALISNAFCVYGGPVATDRDALLALDEAAKELARELHVDYLEYRSGHPFMRIGIAIASSMQPCVAASILTPTRTFSLYRASGEPKFAKAWKPVLKARYIGTSTAFTESIPRAFAIWAPRSSESAISKT